MSCSHNLFYNFSELFDANYKDSDKPFCVALCCLGAPSQNQSHSDQSKMLKSSKSKNVPVYNPSYVVRIICDKHHNTKLFYQIKAND